MFVRASVEGRGGRCWEGRELAMRLFFFWGGWGMIWLRMDV